MSKKKESALHKKLASELASLIPEIDEEGLAFLIEQARVHLYNMEVERLEEKARDLAESDVTSKSRAGSGRKKGPEKPSGYGDFRLERSSSGSSYHIISAGKWKMFNDGEMLSIVRIAQSKDPILEVTKRLCDWFETERPDTFADLELGDHHDPRMKELVLFLRKKFAALK